MRNSLVFLLIIVLCRFACAQQEPVAQGKQEQDTASISSQKKIALKYQGIVETGYCIGQGEWGRSTTRFVMVNALRLSHYSAGIGLGFSLPEHYESEDHTIRFEYQVPLYLDNRFYFTKTKLQPYVSLGTGFSFVNSHMVADVSLYLNATAGIFWEIADHVSLNAGVMGESYTVKYNDQPIGIFEKQSTTLGPFVGIAF